MINRRLEEHGRRRIRIRGAELHAELEDEGLVGGVGRAVDGGGPVRHVLGGGEGGDAWGRVHHDVHELFLEANEGELVGVWVFWEGVGVYRWATFALLLPPLARFPVERAIFFV